MLIYSDTWIRKQIDIDFCELVRGTLGTMVYLFMTIFKFYKVKK